MQWSVWFKFWQQSDGWERWRKSVTSLSAVKWSTTFLYRMVCIVCMIRMAVWKTIWSIWWIRMMHGRKVTWGWGMLRTWFQRGPWKIHGLDDKCLARSLRRSGCWATDLNMTGLHVRSAFSGMVGGLVLISVDQVDECDFWSLGDLLCHVFNVPQVPATSDISKHHLLLLLPILNECSSDSDIKLVPAHVGSCGWLWLSMQEILKNKFNSIMIQHTLWKFWRTTSPVFLGLMLPQEWCISKTAIDHASILH